VDFCEATGFFLERTKVLMRICVFWGLKWEEKMRTGKGRGWGLLLLWWALGCSVSWGQSAPAAAGAQQPAIRLVWGELRGTEVSVADLMRQPQLQLIDSLGKPARALLASYQLAIVRPGDTLRDFARPAGYDTLILTNPVTLEREFRVEWNDAPFYERELYGEQLPEFFLDLLPSLQPGDALLVEQVRAFGPNRVALRVPPLLLLISDL
jgi:hypothetical protein